MASRTGNGRTISEKLLDSRIIYLMEEVTDDLAANITAALLYLYSKDKTKDITIYINSPGGSISAGYAIRDVMNFIDCDIKTVCIGMAASMGAFLLASGTKGKRYILPNADVMIHQPLGGTGQAQATDITIAAQRINYLKDKMIDQMVEMTGQDRERVAMDVERDHWLTAEQAKEYGIVDHVVASIADCESKTGNKLGAMTDDDYTSIINGDDDEDEQADNTNLLGLNVPDDEDESSDNESEKDSIDNPSNA